MKGTPKLPECGFSRAVIQILDLQGVPPEKLKTYNVLEDSELRSDIKEFSYVSFTFLPLAECRDASRQKLANRASSLCERRVRGRM